MSEERPTVLFVDDEASVLRGIRVGLRPERRRYDFLWASSASEALQLVDSNDVDVVFTDMRMPGGSGADLLDRLKEDNPNIVRYVLSGEASSELVMQTMFVAHRWLTKPCPRPMLLEALHDATRYRRLLRGSDLSDALASMSSLPALPDTYLRLQELLADPDVELNDVAELVETDPAISAKLLQLANSAYSGGVGAASVREAVARVGLRTVSHMVLSVGVLRSMQPHRTLADLPGCGVDQCGKRLSELARQLASREATSLASVAGLLSSIGILIQASDFPERLQASYDHALQNGLSLEAAEIERHGSTHADVAGYLLSIWGLPTELVLAVAASANIPDVRADPPFDLATALQAARLMVCHHDGERVGCLLSTPLDDATAPAVERWSQWLAEQSKRGGNT